MPISKPQEAEQLSHEADHEKAPESIRGLMSIGDATVEQLGQIDQTLNRIPSTLEGSKAAKGKDADFAKHLDQVRKVMKKKAGNSGQIRNEISHLERVNKIDTITALKK